MTRDHESGVLPVNTRPGPPSIGGFCTRFSMTGTGISLACHVFVRSPLLRCHLVQRNVGIAPLH